VTALVHQACSSTTQAIPEVRLQHAISTLTVDTGHIMSNREAIQLPSVLPIDSATVTTRIEPLQVHRSWPRTSRMGKSSAIKPDFETAERASARDTPGPRENLVRMLFIHCSTAGVRRYLHVVVSPEQLAERLRSRYVANARLRGSFFPSANCPQTQSQSTRKEIIRQLLCDRNRDVLSNR
jgi:hypothetical protein